jgi:hypothetical protein
VIVRAASVGLAVAGVAVLVWLAAPLRWDGLIEPGAGGPVSGMAFLAVLFGTVAGVACGLLGRRSVKAGQSASTGRRRAPVIAMLVVSAVALWPFGLFVARFSQADQEPFGSSRVLETSAAWLAYLAIAYLLYHVVSGQAAGHQTQAPRSSEPHR